MGTPSRPMTLDKARTLRRLILPLLVLLLSILVLPLASRAQAPPPLPVLRTARQAHILSAQEAAHGYPVHLAHAQVTFFQPSLDALFLMDPSDGLFVDLRGQKQPAVREGDLVVVDAFTATGDVASVLVRAQIRVLGHAPLPHAPLVTLDHLSSGAWDARWVSVEGVVRSVIRPDQPETNAGHRVYDSRDLILTLQSGQDTLIVMTPFTGGSLPTHLVDARVRLRAAAASRFNDRRQFTGVQLCMPDLSFVQVLRPAPPDPFAIPLSTTTTITRLGSQEPGHRVHIRGVVTSSFDDRHFSVLDSEHGIFVTTQSPVSVQPGDRLDVAGFPFSDHSTFYLDGALARRLGSTSLPQPVPLSVATAFEGAHDAEPIQLEGTLVDRYGAGAGSRSFLLSDLNDRTFLAVLPPQANSEFLDRLRTGSRLRVSGICVIHNATTRSMNLLLRSAADVQVLHMASWWTPRYTLILAVVLALIGVIIAARNLGLRRRVTTQTLQIQSQLEEAHALRIHAEAATQEKSQTLERLLSTQRDLLIAQEKLRYQATHDALTGLWNRAALLDFLHKETERALRTHGSLGILLLDVDFFKPVNDTHGHLTGDAVLREIGCRLIRSIRPYDIAGRYGGEEFLILLPDCDPAQIEPSAERIRAAIGAAPFEAGDVPLTLTVSIGATVAPDFSGIQLHDPEDRASDADLSRADCALYEAKSAGRNRTVVRLHDPIPA